jgi:hypothetical protein
MAPSDQTATALCRRDPVWSRTVASYSLLSLDTPMTLANVLNSSSIGAWRPVPSTPVLSTSTAIQGSLVPDGTYSPFTSIRWGFVSSALGTLTSRTPLLHRASIASGSTLVGRRMARWNEPKRRSTRRKPSASFSS